MPATHVTSMAGPHTLKFSEQPAEVTAAAKTAPLLSDSDVDNCRVQSFLESWATTHLDEGEHEHDVVVAMIELLQETLK